MMVSNLLRLINRFVCFLNTVGLHCAHALFSPSNQSPILIREKNGGEGGDECIFVGFILRTSGDKKEDFCCEV